MKARQNLRDNVNALMEERGWKSNAPIIKASDKRLTNGTLGRIRSPQGENAKLSQVEELANVFEVEPHELLAPPQPLGATMKGWPLSPELLAALQNADPQKRAFVENTARLALGLAITQTPTQETSGAAA